MNTVTAPEKSTATAQAPNISTAEHPVILFDGVCNMCNASVNFVMRNDPKGLFHYSSLQDPAGQALMQSYGQDPTYFDSVVLIKNGRFYNKSRAALEIARHLKGLWPALYAFIIVPGVVRDAVYNFIARNRYRWFGKKETCRLPTPAERALFL